MNTFAPSQKEHVFFSTVTVIMVMEIVIGFSGSYLPKVIGRSVELPGIIHIHALVFALWLVFFLFQVTLVLRKKVALHMQLGNWGVLFTLVMLAVGCAAAIATAKLGHKGLPGVEFPGAEGFLFLNLSSLVVFISLTSLGWINRNNPIAHKRFMLMASIGGISPPGISRLPFIAGSTPAIAIAVLVLLFAGPAYDLIRYRRIHWAYLIALIITLVSLPPVILVLSATSAWQKIGEWLMQG